ncbi:MAG: GGDEF domain-containing protein [Gemmatimonadetes bacterium]|nr:GGDEF domain-containing protein [Gemmatimonadota bacterium]
MNTVSPNLYIAALGPLSELLGVLVIVGVFTLLRGQADRRPYFTTWEKAFVFFAVSLTAGLFYERFVNPSSVFYPSSPVTTKLTAMAFLVFRVMAMAMFVSGAQLFTRGEVAKWMPRVAVAIGIVLALLANTTTTPLAPFRIMHGPLAALAYTYAAFLFGSLPRSRRSIGTWFAAISFALLALLGASLAAFYASQTLAPELASMPWAVRWARYGFYTDLLLRFALAWAMVRLLTEDSRREADDTRAHIRLLQDREKLGDLYDSKARLLGRRAFDAFVGLDFARASFGSVALLRIANYERVTTQYGPAVADAMVANVGGVLDSAVRAHDRVYRWSPAELLIVMPRAVPSVARERIEFMAGRVAALSVAGAKEPLRAEAAVSVQFFRGGEHLAEAAAAAARV